MSRALRFLRRVVLLLATVVALGLVGGIVFAWRCPPQRAAAEVARNPVHASFGSHTRPEEDTFFSYPEWYIVWSYQEKSDHQQRALPSRFPYFHSIAQYWQSYCCVNRIVKGNFGAHLMLATIGSSFTLEYGLKGAYEKTIGWFTEWTSGFQPAEEDLYAAKIAKEYAGFVHIRPFYEFPFFRSLGGLWRETKLWGPRPVRKWERKIWLSLDYFIEGRGLIHDRRSVASQAV